jgi:hypothetical protein
MHFAPAIFPKPVFWQNAIVLFATMGAALLLYLGGCLALRVEETNEAARIVLRKLRRKT